MMGDAEEAGVTQLVLWSLFEYIDEVSTEYYVFSSWNSLSGEGLCVPSLQHVEREFIIRTSYLEIYNEVSLL